MSTNSDFEHDELLSSLADHNPVSDGDGPDGDDPAATALLHSILTDSQSFEPYSPPSARRAPRRRWGAIVAAAAAVALLAGFVATVMPSSSAPALATVQEAAANTGQVSSGRAITTFRVEAAGEGTLSGTLTTSFDGADLSASVHLDQVPHAMSEEMGAGSAASDSPLHDSPFSGGPLSGSVSAETVVVDGTAYISPNGEEWIAVEVPAFMLQDLTALTDARTVLGLVGDLTEVSELGEGDEDDLGVATTHFRGSVDLGADRSADADWLPAMVGEIGEALDGVVTVDLWVADGSLLRRVAVAGDLTSADPAHGDGTAVYSVVTDFTELGGDIAITVPEGEIRSMELPTE